MERGRASLQRCRAGGARVCPVARDRVRRALRAAPRAAQAQPRPRSALQRARPAAPRRRAAASCRGAAPPRAAGARAGGRRGLPRRAGGRRSERGRPGNWPSRPLCAAHTRAHCSGRRRRRCGHCGCRAGGCERALEPRWSVRSCILAPHGATRVASVCVHCAHMGAQQRHMPACPAHTAPFARKQHTPCVAGILIAAAKARARQIVDTAPLRAAAAVHAGGLSEAAAKGGSALRRSKFAWNLLQQLACYAPNQLAAALPTLPRLATQALTAWRGAPPPRFAAGTAQLPKGALGFGCARAVGGGGPCAALAWAQKRRPARALTLSATHAQVHGRPAR